MSRRSKHRWRQFRFAILRRAILPLALWPVRLLMWTWRWDATETSAVADLARPGSPPRALAVMHGDALLLLGLCGHLRREGSRFRVNTLVSPSRDGRLLADVIEAFGQRTTAGSSSKRGAPALREMIRAVESGDIALVAVDGPRGPCGGVKSGAVSLAASTRATLHVMALEAHPSRRLGTWDRQSLASPFARVRVRVAPVHDFRDGGPVDRAEISAVRERAESVLQAAAVELGRDPGDFAPHGTGHHG